MASERLINWKTADDMRLKPTRVLERRAEQHASGAFFVINELVEYDGGQKGWRHRKETARSGAPYTPKFRDLAAAEAEIRELDAKDAAVAAKRLLEAQGVEANVGALQRLYEKTPPKDGKGPTAAELAALWHEEQRAVAEAVAIIGGEGGEAPDEVSLRLAFRDGHRSPASLVAAWRDIRESRERKRASEALKERKARERAERREREDAFLRAKAAKKAAADGIAFPGRAALSLVGRSAEGGDWALDDREGVLDRIAERLDDYPWLRHVLCYDGSWLRLFISEDGLRWEEWGRYEKYQRKRLIAERAQVADAFGMDPTDNWTKVRGALLRQLKPGELDLLHRADVVQALGAARADGKTLVVIRRFAFLWDEVSGEWRQRDIVRRGSPGDSAGPSDTLWLDGPIHSTNYGRIIVLPYVKADGTHVIGHTRNAPGEGDAKPRAEMLVIRFAVYDELGRDEAWDHQGNVFIDARADGAYG